MLPADPKSVWPPEQWRPKARGIDEAAAWYAGDEDSLAGFYGGIAASTAQVRSSRARFWQRRRADLHSDRQRLHLPVAADVATVGADLLFGETPTFTIPAAHLERPDPVAQAVEARLLELLDADGVPAKLLEAAELAAGLGGVYLRPVWDTAGLTQPTLTVVTPDRAVPEFSWGRVTAVTFWRELQTDEHTGHVWRHLERHDAAGIEHGLYVGDAGGRLGKRVPLDRHAVTAELLVDDAGMVELPAGVAGRTFCYVPNVLPNRQWRGLPIGRSDTAGCEALMDGIDEAWSSWLRDIRLGKARIIVPDEFLDRDGRGKGAGFDPDREVFSPLSMDPGSRQQAGIELLQPAIRHAEHGATILELLLSTLRSAGYSPQTLGLGPGGGARTATEVRADEGRSLRTTERKGRYWRAALRDVAEVLLILDREVYRSQLPAMRPQVELADPLGRDVRDVASTLNLLNLAAAASTEQKVRMLHPEWDEAQVGLEVDAILREQAGGAMPELPDPTGGVPMPGDHDDDAGMTGEPDDGLEA